MPQASIDPVVMAAATVMRLQTIVSREVAATDAAVITVGVLQAGTKENVIPDDATHQAERANLRRGRTKARPCGDRSDRECRGRSLRRTAQPEITSLDHYPLNVNDAAPATVSARRFEVTSRRTGCGTRVPRPRARTSDASAPRGRSLRCSGSSAAPIRTSTRRPGRRDARTAARQSQPALCTGPASNAGRPASRRWSSVR